MSPMTFAGLVDELGVRRRRGADELQPPQKTIYVPAKVYASDGLLPGIASLRVRYRAELIEVRFLRNRRVVHVDSPLAGRLDARMFQRRYSDRSAGEQLVAK